MATPTVVSAQLLSWVLWVLVWAAALLLATVLGTRAGRQWRERRDAKLLGELRPAMLEVASGEDDDASALRRLTAVPRRRVPVVDRAVSAMLSKVRGEPARALAQVLDAHGRAEWAIAGLSSHSAVRRAARGGAAASSPRTAQLGGRGVPVRLRRRSGTRDRGGHPAPGPGGAPCGGNCDRSAPRARCRSRRA
ncbi:hypothetical protein [Kocuria sp. KD4]|uniref:hypothetical protein n=1 Tax=Kocuria sp. KD4 TaxID=2719588 RepID=UPI001F10B899|nr:hypothetical protein [Kocuria sp. KD4]